MTIAQKIMLLIALNLVQYTTYTEFGCKQTTRYQQCQFVNKVVVSRNYIIQCYSFRKAPFQTLLLNKTKFLAFCTFRSLCLALFVILLFHVSRTQLRCSPICLINCSTKKNFFINHLVSLYGIFRTQFQHSNVNKDLVRNGAAVDRSIFLKSCIIQTIENIFHFKYI